MPDSDHATNDRAGDARRLLRTLSRGLGVGLVCLVAYVALVAVLTFTRMNGTLLIQRLVPLPEPGGVGFALQRFREAEQAGPVDIVFVGPSSCYRSFDPRWYRERGYTSMNLGSTAQCPVTTYHLLKKYLGGLRPKLVVLDVSQMALAIDGLESLSDLAGNLPVDSHVVAMASSVGNVVAANVTLAAALRNWRTPLAEVDQKPVVYDRYVPGGFLDTTKPYQDHQWADGMSFAIRPDQWSYLERILELLRERDIGAVAVSMPMMKKARGKVVNYDSNYEKIATLMASNGVPYVELNYELRLDDREDFIDELHLSPAGVVRTNQFFLQWLEKTGLSPDPSRSGARTR